MNATTEPHPHAMPAVLFRERVCDDDGQPLDDVPENWAMADDGREPVLQELGRGHLLIVSVNDSDFFFEEVDSSIDGDAEIVRAVFTSESPCPMHRMGDILAVTLDDGSAISYEVLLTHGDMPHRLVEPGEVCLVLRAELSVV